ncbi:hypothetical protein MPSEU_000234800 [Mayamaea pseudoterrestris]|nr:hypothetical protein MPSEU_000234800 [Mayamaea pseudoterrestris]
MRLTAELLSQVEQRTNPVGDRELVLRELGIPMLENLGAARDEFDSYDLSNNRLFRLENFPKLQRLAHLHCAGNLIEGIDGRNLKKNVPNLLTLNLSDNNISSLAEVASLASACEKLESLSLVNNPVTRRQHYRLYTIHRIPTLKVLDFTKVRASERDRAERLASSAAGAALEGDVQQEAKQTSTKTFDPGEALDDAKAVIISYTSEQKDQIRELLANASSAKELEEIEAAVRKGVLPEALQAADRKRKRDNGANEGAEIS